jgi:HEAT repeat protein
MTLNQWGGSTVRRGLRQIARSHSDAGLRKWAVYMLGFVGEGRDLDLLLTALDDEDLDVRCHAAEAIGHLMSFRRNRRKAIPRLLQLLDDAEPELRFWSIFAIASIGDEREVPALERLLDDRALVKGWWSVRREARWAIDRIRAGSRNS